MPFIRLRQVVFYIAVLSLDIRRMELSDIEGHRQHHRRVFRHSDDDGASDKESTRTQFEALETALKDSSKQTTIILNSGCVLLSMVCY